jgi:rhomboid family GlyGly-CTERM serine protease
LTPGRVGWAALAALLAAAGLLGGLVDATRIDWRPELAAAQPWRAWTAVAVHYSGLHLAGNLASAAVVGVFGVAARVGRGSVVAWAVAWPLTQLGLLLRPDLVAYGGLSGVMHAGVAIAAVHLLADGAGRQRAVGAAVLAGLAIKVIGEQPWGPALRHGGAWDIAVAPFAHASGAVAGLVCASVARVLTRRAATVNRHA